MPHRKFGSPYLGKAQQPQKQRDPLLPGSAVFSCVQTITLVWLFGIFNVRTDVDASLFTHRVCRNTVRECALEVDSGGEIPCCTRDSNPHQYCAWLFSRTLYQLSHPHPWRLMKKSKRTRRKKNKNQTNKNKKKKKQKNSNNKAKPGKTKGWETKTSLLTQCLRFL